MCYINKVGCIPFFLKQSLFNIIKERGASHNLFFVVLRFTKTGSCKRHAARLYSQGAQVSAMRLGVWKILLDPTVKNSPVKNFKLMLVQLVG